MIRNVVARVSLLLAAVVALAPSAARADRRDFGETCSAVTAPRGALDLELWSTFHDRPREGGLHLWRHQVELEAGASDAGAAR